MVVTTPTVWASSKFANAASVVAGTAGGGLLMFPYGAYYESPTTGGHSVESLSSAIGFQRDLISLPDFTFAYGFGDSVSGDQDAGFRLIARNLTWNGPAQKFLDLANEIDVQLAVNGSGIIGATITRYTTGQQDHQVYFGTTALGLQNAVRPYAVNSDHNSNATVSALNNGNFIVTWQRENDAGNRTVMMSIVTPEGTVLNERSVSNSGVGIANPDVITLKDGSSVISWEDSATSRLYYHVVSSSGTDIGSPRFIADDGKSVKLTALRDGGFLLGWTQNGEEYNGEAGITWRDHDVYVQRFDSEGNAVGSPFEIAIPGNQNTLLNLVETRDGRVAVVYTREIDSYFMIIDPRGDTISGGSDQDVIYGRLDGSTIIGNGGDDLLFGMGANDHLFGGEGADELNGGAGIDVMEGGAGNDIYYVDNAGDVVSEAAAGSSGIDEVRTTVSYTLAAIAAGGLVENLTLLGTTQNIDGVGNAVDNTITGNKGNNRLSGLGGDDRLVASYGDDILIGGSGDDSLFGTFGNDVLNGGSGADYLSGGEGRDRASYSDASAGVVASLLNPNLNTGAAKGDTYHSIEILNGSSFNDTLGGDNNANELWGLAGNDNLSGGNGNDILKGDDGNDELTGGAGADHLYGGAGADTFLFLSYTQSTLPSRDVIYDFSRAQADAIDISAIDARTTEAGNQAFTFIGTAEFSKKAGELRYLKKDGDTFIHADLNGDGSIDFSIRLDSTIDLKSTDFIL